MVRAANPTPIFRLFRHNYSGGMVLFAAASSVTATKGRGTLRISPKCFAEEFRPVLPVCCSLGPSPPSGPQVGGASSGGRGFHAGHVTGLVATAVAAAASSAAPSAGWCWRRRRWPWWRRRRWRQREGVLWRKRRPRAV
ncbi:hypothetical protein HJG60_008295 [Phyllostomus discolor]|uniref:Uncharacterized protein n=1 Tax=Phyllostomus discolor TaxID=89673 RepID=A0A833Z6V5_9CHIR|nr:hypothetical protein HJG60_008295 [Phyllostomus discolor]